MPDHYHGSCIYMYGLGFIDLLQYRMAPLQYFVLQIPIELFMMG
ncbi:hypothetical protein CI610_00669 [invertebrate metagenome]|uniref:Uncharacterized protein n=1 Tax=invertebrate metagenome TaxID=1711999 RepID=A0A2H9TAR1_9ZZZZ